MRDSCIISSPKMYLLTCYMFTILDRVNASKKHVLLVIDAFTKFVKLYAVKTTTSRKIIRSLKEYFNAYSKPKILISDRGTSFTSKEFKNFINKSSVKHIKIAIIFPQVNEQVERYNRILASALNYTMLESSISRRVSFNLR